MADATQVVGTNDKGQYQVNVPRSDITRIDVVDIDFVIQTKSGARLIIPGAAMDAMSLKPPAIHFADGPISSADMLASVERVETPATSVPAMSSLTEHELKKSEGNKNVTRDGPEGRKAEADAAAQEAQSQQVAPLPQGTESSVDKLVAKAEQMSSDIMKKAFDPAPVKPFEPPASNPDAPGSQPPTAKIPLLVTMSIGNVVSDGTGIVGQGGPAGSNIASKTLNNDARQYGTETLIGSDAGNDVIRADAFDGLANGGNSVATYDTLDKDTGTTPGSFYYAKEMAFTVAGYLRRTTSITISGLPTGVTIEGANLLGNGSFSLAESLVIPTATVLKFVYDVTAMRAKFDKDSDHDGVNDYVDFDLTFNIKGYGVGEVDVTKVFRLRFQDVDSTTDITANNPVPIDGSYSDIYVMPTASAPHSIDGGGGDDTIYAGNSADSINGGADDDKIYAFAGNDIIRDDDGDNEVWAGAGNDTVTTGGGADNIHGGSGNDIITSGASNDVIDGGEGDDVITGGTGNNQVAGGAGTDTLSFADAAITSVTLTLDANGNLSGAMTRSDGGADTIVTGFENVIGSSGADSITFIGSGNVANTVWGGTGNDAINSGDGNDTVYGEDGDDVINGSTGNDVLNGGNGADTITGGGGTDELNGGAGNDVFLAILNDGADTHDGGAGTDKVSYAAETTNITVNLNSTVSGIGGSAAGDTYTSIEWIVGGSGDDSLTGSSTTVILEGGAGNDAITANSSTTQGGNATLYGDVRNSDESSGSSSSYGVSLLTNWSNNSSWANTTANGTNWGNFNTALGDRLTGSNVSGTTTTMYGGSGYNQYTLQNETDVVYGGTNNATDFDRIVYSNSSSGTVATTGLAGSGVFINIDTINHTWTNGGVVNSGTNGYWWNGTDWTQMTGTAVFNNTANANSGQYGWAAGDTYSDIEQVIGSGSADVIFGNGESNVINAGGGNDAVFAMGGDDWLFASNGNDYIDGGDNSAVTLATGGDVVDYSSYGAITADLSRTAGFVKIGSSSTAAGAAKLVNVEGIIGSNSADNITGSSSADRIDGRIGNDVVSAGAGADIVYGGWGGSGGADVLDGGTGAGADGTFDSDWVSYAGINAAGVSGFGIELYLADADLDADGTLDQIQSTFLTTRGYSRYDTGNNTYEYDTLSNFENVEGTGFADRIAGTTSANIIYGLAGNDTIFGGGGGDSIDGGSDTDTVTYYGIKNTSNVLLSVTVDLNGTNGGNAGGAAGDTLVSIENIVGTALADTIYGDGNANQIDGGASGDILDGGGGGADTLWYNSSTAAVTVNLGTNTASGGWAQGDVISNFENLRGSAYDDVLTGSSSVNTIWGGLGNDTIEGGIGNGSLYGEGGTDTVSYLAYSASAVTVNLTTGSATGGGGNDILSGFENVTGSIYNDTLTGDASANTLWGDAGNDSLIGNTGNDLLNGGAGTDMADYSYATTSVVASLLTNTATVSSGDSDTFISIENLRGGTGADTLTGDAAINTIYGGAGNDNITGGGGADSLYGETGSDTFTFTNAQITDAAVISGGAVNADTDRITVTDSWTFSAGTFTNAKFVGIEQIYARDGATGDAFSLNSADIQNIVDNGNNSTLTLYLDTGDTFQFSSVSSGNYTQPGGAYSTFTNNGLALAAGTYHLDYTNSSNTQIAHLNLVVG